MQHLWEVGHYSTGIRNLEKNPPCNAEDNLRAGLIVIEAWFGGYNDDESGMQSCIRHCKAGSFSEYSKVVIEHANSYIQLY